MEAQSRQTSSRRLKLLSPERYAYYYYAMIRNKTTSTDMGYDLPALIITNQSQHDRYDNVTKLGLMLFFT